MVHPKPVSRQLNPFPPVPTVKNKDLIIGPDDGVQGAADLNLPG